jgi:5'-nucleotidase
MKPARHLLALLAILLAASSVGADDAGNPRAGAALTLLQINDVYVTTPVDGGKAGGLARVAALKKKLAAEGRPVLLALPGDFLSPSVASSVFKGKQMIDALNATGVDIATLGNHEFDFGPDVLRERMKEAKWKWVVSNTTDLATKKPLGGADAFLIQKYGALKVGFIGLLLSGDEISKDKLRGVKIEDPFAAAARLLPVLKKAGADTIVAITHLDYADDRRLAQRFPQIDVILGGHEHFPITTHVGRTRITKAGSDARFVARVDLSRTGPGAPLERQFELIPIVEGMPDDPETARVAAEYESKLDKELQVVLGSTRTPLNAVAERVRAGESNLGNLMADAMRADTKADIAIVNAGSIRSNQVFPAGPLTRRDVVAIHPFGGVTCKVETTGAVVLAALNNGVSRLGESVGRFPQVSGLTFSADPALPAGNRVRDVMVNGQPLDLKKTYTVAINDYLLKGGDGYSMFTTARVLVNPETGNFLIAGLEDLIRERKEVAPEVEGRIRIGRAAPVAAKKPLILDTDMGIDSVMGMLFLLKDPEVAVKAVTIVHGVADVQAGAANALRVLELTGQRAVPVAAGRSTPLQGQRSFPAFWREQANTLGGAKLPTAQAKLRPEPAEDLILAELERSSDPVTIAALGPLTNIALALRKKPDAAKKIREIVVMGGAVRGPGNVGNPFVGIKNSAAEWNFYLDPHAAKEVLATGVAVRLVPLESTKAVPVTAEFVDRIRTANRDQASEFMLALLNAIGDGIKEGYYYFWDAFAAVAAAHPEVSGTHEERITVVTDDGPTFGRTAPTPNGVNVKVAEEINRKAFEDRLLRVILQ